MASGKVMLRFTIPGPPVPCQRARSDGRQWYTPKRTKDFKELVGWVSRQAVGANREYPSAEALTLVCQFWLKDRTRRDLDNLVKGVKDGMTGIVWIDDSQVACELLCKYVDRSNPRTDVFVYRYEPGLIDKAMWELGHGVLRE